jgi:hypothetical protein
LTFDTLLQYRLLLVKQGSRGRVDHVVGGEGRGCLAQRGAARGDGAGSYGRQDTVLARVLGKIFILFFCEL